MLRVTVYIGCIVTLAARSSAGEVVETVDTAPAAAAAGVVAAPHTVDTILVAEGAEMQTLAADTVPYTAVAEVVVGDKIAGAAGHMTAAVGMVVVAAAA